MPIIFVDLHDGKDFIKETHGFDLPDKDAVRERLVRIMAKIARSLSADTDRQDFLAIARDTNGKILFRVRLSLDIEEIDQI
jgi:hypothetical protein